MIRSVAVLFAIVLVGFSSLTCAQEAAQEPAQPPAATPAQRPAHCERDRDPGRWPVVREPAAGAETSAISPREARDVVRAFRRHWAHVPHATPVLSIFTECMVSSDDHFMVRRVMRSDVQTTLRGPSVRLAGDADAVPDVPWVWEIYWGGASRRLVPSGPVSMFLSADLQTLLGAVQHLEG